MSTTTNGSSPETRPGSGPSWRRRTDGGRRRMAPGRRATGHWRTLTFLGALRCHRFPAACVFDGPIGQAFARIRHQTRIAWRCTVEASWRRIGALAATIQPGEGSNCIADAGCAFGQNMKRSRRAGLRRLPVLTVGSVSPRCGRSGNRRQRRRRQCQRRRARLRRRDPGDLRGSSGPCGRGSSPA
jgi:hypothetical protein